MKIKPCPFCGASASIKEYKDEEAIDIPFPTYYVKCNFKECGASLGNTYYSEEEAIKVWNRRGANAWKETGKDPLKARAPETKRENKQEPELEPEEVDLFSQMQDWWIPMESWDDEENY